MSNRQLTTADIQRAQQALRRERASQQRSAKLSKNAFLAWLGRVGLEFLVDKFLGYAWDKIRNYMGF